MIMAEFLLLPFIFINPVTLRKAKIVYTSMYFCHFYEGKQLSCSFLFPSINDETLSEEVFSQRKKALQDHTLSSKVVIITDLGQRQKSA